jgi:hypothetical protein
VTEHTIKGDASTKLIASLYGDFTTSVILDEIHKITTSQHQDVFSTCFLKVLPETIQQ